ncbi:MAG: hypothetical protein WKG00_23530 [Polyangiaceae bacterium]
MRMPAFLLLAFLAACGGGATSPTTADDPSSTGGATGKAKDKVPEWKLGHWSSPDGLVGMVIDRNGAKPKIKIDGQKDVVELHLEKHLDRGDSKGNWLNGPDGKHWMFLGEGGQLAFIKPETRDNAELRHAVGFLPMTRDADADALGAATQVGIATPPPAKRPYQLHAEKLAGISVTTRLRMKPEDSGNLAKVAEAMEKATPDMFVRVPAKASEKATWAPASELIAGTIHSGYNTVTVQAISDEPWDKTKPGLKRYGLELRAKPTFGEPSRIRQGKLRGWPPGLPPNTPGLVWHVQDGTKIVFVAVDGGRWELGDWYNDFDAKAPPVEAGTGPQSAWPAPLASSAIDVGLVRGLAKGGAIPAKTAADIEAIDDGWFECVQKVWKEGRAEADKIEATQAPLNDKYGKLSGVAKKYEVKAEQTCAPIVKKLDEALTRFIEARDTERKAIFDKARARTASIAR